MHQSAYRNALASAMALPVERFDVAGVSVVFGEDRRGERLVSHYRVGRHSVVWADPELADALAGCPAPDAALMFDEFGDWARDRGAELLGRGLEHLLAEGYSSPARPTVVEVLDGRATDVASMVTALLGECSADDRELADFDPDALDRFLTGWVDRGEGGRGQLRALAGGRPWAPRPGFVDVGVLVRPDARRGGRGRAVIAAVVDEVLAAGEAPLYRCGVHNEGSRRLCLGLGFELVVELEAFRWPTGG